MKGQNFKQKVLKGLNKTEKERQEEAVQTFIDDSIIECETQIALLETSYLPKAQNELKRANNSLDKAKKAYEDVKFSTYPSFEEYVEAREDALDNIDDAEGRVKSAENDIENINKQIAKFKEILSDLSN